MAGYTSRSDCQLPKTTPRTNKDTIGRGFSRLSRLGKVNCAAFHGSQVPKTYCEAPRPEITAAAASTATVVSAKRVRGLTTGRYTRSGQ